jgi:hypothetical protein
MKTSYSQNNTYIKCPQHWYLSYYEKWEPLLKGASLYFGSAVDEAAEALLQGRSDYLQKFYDRWDTAEAFGTRTKVFDNPDVVFAHNDFDGDILTAAEFAQLNIWGEELGLIPKGTVLPNADVVALFKRISKDKQNPYKGIGPLELVFFNRAGWLSMKRKGEILIEAFKTQFLPKVKRVLSTQQYAKIVSNNGDIVSGFIDMVLEIDGYSKPVIFDLKTAGRPYSQEDIELTNQLTLYSAMKGVHSNDPQKFQTDLVGYIVLCKNIQKDVVATCKSCGHTRNSQHKTCDNTVNGTRCKGEWLETKVPKPEVQVMVQSKTPEQIHSMLRDVSSLIAAMSNLIVYKNTDMCNDWYGGRCPFYNACHKDDFSNLRKRGAT